MKNHIKLTILTGAIYALTLAILIATFWTMDGSDALGYSIVYMLAFRTVLISGGLCLVNAIVRGSSVFTYILPLACGLGAGACDLVTWGITRYTHNQDVDLGSILQNSLYTVGIAAVAAVIGLAIHYAVKHIKRSRAVV